MEKKVGVRIDISDADSRLCGQCEWLDVVVGYKCLLRHCRLFYDNLGKMEYDRYGHYKWKEYPRCEECLKCEL